MISPDVNTPDPRRWLALAVLLLVQFMLILDVSVVNIALPDIARDLRFTRSGLTWVVDGYVLMAGGLLLLGGRLGDVLGRRRLFLAGTALFGAASLACATAQQPWQLVTARFVQGAGEALAAPAALGLIALLFTERAERAKAIGFFGGISGLAGTSGPILSGLLVESASWRWIFLINLPVAAAALVAVPRLVAVHTPTSQDGQLDLVGAVGVVLGFGGLVYGAITAGKDGWGSTTALLPLVGGGALLLAVVAYEARARNPLVPLRFFADRTRRAANTVAPLFYAVFFTQFFLTTLYLQDVLGFSALRAGFAFLPFGIAIGAGIGVATALVPRVGLRPVLTIGLLLTAAGVAAFTRISASGSFLGQVLPASLLVALGSGLVLPCLGIAAVNAVTEQDAGLAAGLQQALQQVAGAVGLAVLSSVALRRASHLVATGSGPAVATTSGYRLAFTLGAALLLVSSAAAAGLLPNGANTAHEQAVSP